MTNRNRNRSKLRQAESSITHVSSNVGSKHRRHHRHTQPSHLTSRYHESFPLLAVRVVRPSRSDLSAHPPVLQTRRDDRRLVSPHHHFMHRPAIQHRHSVLAAAAVAVAVAVVYRYRLNRLLHRSSFPPVVVVVVVAVALPFHRSNHRPSALPVCRWVAVAVAAADRPIDSSPLHQRRSNTNPHLTPNPPLPNDKRSLSPSLVRVSLFCSYVLSTLISFVRFLRFTNSRNDSLLEVRARFEFPFWFARHKFTRLSS